jgi:hypothetical protein
MTRCGVCFAPLTDEEISAYGTGTADDHVPCGKPAVVVFEGDWKMRLEVAPPGSPISHDGAALSMRFTAAERCDGMGV